MTLAHASAGAISTQWNLDPFAIGGAILVAALYANGLYATGMRAVGRVRVAAFAAGMGVAVAATVSPLHGGAELRFSAHMTQHLLYMLAAAPLIVSGRPALVVALGLPSGWRRTAWALGGVRPITSVLRAARRPVCILVAYTAVVWMWHLPGPYEATLAAEGIHALEHVSFLGVALAFWAVVLRAGPRRRVGYVPAMALTLGTMLQGTWLAAILTFGRLAFPAYAARARIAGIDPLSDQQVAGAIMWIPAAIIHLSVFGILFVAWFRELDARHARTPAPAPSP